MEKVFTIGGSGVPELIMETWCDVHITHGGYGSVKVAIFNDDGTFDVHQKGNQVFITQKGVKGSGGVSINTVFSGGRLVQSQVVSGRGATIVGGGVVITGASGDVIINGKRINLDDIAGEDVPPTPRIHVVIPNGSILDGTFGGIGDVKVEPVLSQAYINASTSASVIVQVEGAMNVHASSSGEIGAKLNGSLNAQASSSGRVVVTGMFSDVNASASSSGLIETTGHCNGDYIADASSSGSVRHSGGVDGRVRPRESSSGRVSVR